MNVFIYIYYKALDCHVLSKICDPDTSKIIRKTQIFKVIFFTYMYASFFQSHDIIKNIYSCMKKSISDFQKSLKKYSYQL